MRRWIGSTTLHLLELAQLVRDKALGKLVGGAFGRLGRSTTLCWPYRLSGAQDIEVGDGVFLGPGAWLLVVRSEGRPRGRIRVGDGCSSSGSLVLSAVQEVVLEERVLLARNVYVSDHIHAYEDRTRAVRDQGVAKVAPVRICAGAWLGQNVVVCPGVTIGAGAVVGANSVVTEDIPAHSVAVGAPARVVRTF